MIKYIFIIVFLLLTQTLLAQDKIELDTTTIKGNSELPKILYVVPWSEKIIKQSQSQKLVLHSLFGNFLEPTLPALTNAPPSKAK